LYKAPCGLKQQSYYCFVDEVVTNVALRLITTSIRQLEEAEAERLTAVALGDTGCGISDVWAMMVFNEGYIDAALALIDLESDPPLGPATLFFALQQSLGGTRAEAARALALRLVEQHRDAVLRRSNGFLALVHTDLDHFVWHKAVQDSSLAVLVGKISSVLGKSIVDAKDMLGRTA
jgi:hypothetical protein